MLVTPVLAEEQSPPASERVATHEMAVSEPSLGPSPAPISTASRTYVVHGATIAWNLEQGRLAQPTVEQAARIAEGLQRLVEGQNLDARGRLAAEEQFEVRTFSNGLQGARLPISHINASVIRIDDDGDFEQLCVDGTEQARAVLTSPPTDRRGEE